MADKVIRFYWICLFLIGVIFVSIIYISLFQDSNNSDSKNNETIKNISIFNHQINNTKYQQNKTSSIIKVEDIQQISDIKDPNLLCGEDYYTPCDVDSIFKCVNKKGKCCNGVWCGNICYEKTVGYKCINDEGYCDDKTSFICHNQEGICSYLNNERLDYFFNKENYIIGQQKIFIYSNINDMIYDRVLNSGGLEFVYCLYGSLYKDSFIIDEIYEHPYYYVTSENASNYACVNNSFGKIHYHPNGYCDLSDADKLDLPNSSRIGGVVCGKERYNLFEPIDLTKKIHILLVDKQTNIEKDITLIGSSICSDPLYFCNNTCYEECEEGIFECRESKGICI